MYVNVVTLGGTYLFSNIKGKKMQLFRGIHLIELI